MSCVWNNVTSIALTVQVDPSLVEILGVKKIQVHTSEFLAMDAQLGRESWSEDYHNSKGECIGRATRKRERAGKRIDKLAENSTNGERGVCITNGRYDKDKDLSGYQVYSNCTRGSWNDYDDYQAGGILIGYLQRNHRSSGYPDSINCKYILVHEYAYGKDEVLDVETLSYVLPLDKKIQSMNVCQHTVKKSDVSALTFANYQFMGKGQGPVSPVACVNDVNEVLSNNS